MNMSLNLCGGRQQGKEKGGREHQLPTAFWVEGMKRLFLAVFLVLLGRFAAGGAAGAIPAALAAEAAVFADEHQSGHKADHNDQKHQNGGQIHE